MPSLSSSSTDDFALHAWVDESMKFPQEGPGTYLLAAVVADSACCDEPRRRMSQLGRAAGVKLHWHAEGRASKRKISSSVAGFDVASIVVVGMALDRKKQERGRVQCMETLLQNLVEMDVSRVFLETRTRSLNVKDEKTIERLRGRRAIPSSLRIEMVQPSGEPMLWIPDAVAGAVGDDRNGEPEWLATMGSIAQQIEIVLR